MAALMKFDTLSWAKKLEQVGVPPQQAEVQVELIFRAIDDNICTKQDLCELEGNISIKLKELELKIEGIRRESLGIKSDLELKIEETRKETVGVKTDLTVAMEKLNASISKQIAQWVLGVSVIQTTVLLTLIRFMH
jgi:hypothetical protein